MRRALIGLAAILAAAAPAAATEWIVCEGDGAQMSMLVGDVAGIAINRANFSVGETNWSTSPELEPGTRVLVGQAFETPTMLAVDLTDEGMGTVVAELRLFKAEEAADYVQAGTLRVPGLGAWAVTCSGP